MADDIQAPVIRDPETLDAFGRQLFNQFCDYERDRWGLEQQWLTNLRQYKGQWDPEIEKRIPKDRSKAYPKLTKVKVTGTVSRLMEMLFPQTEKNWGLEPSPIPSLKREDLQGLLDHLSANLPEGELTDDEVEREVMKFAKEKAGKMSVTIDDQLAEHEYVSLVKQVVQSGVIYGVGRLCGPFVKRRQVARWRRNAITGKYETYLDERLVPFYEHGSVWNWYPDLSAKTWEQTDGYFEREVHSRAQVRDLAERVDYFGDRVKKWLKDNTSGNYKERYWEQEIRAKSKDRSNPSNLSGRKYESLKWWGFVPGEVLAAAGIDMSGKELHEMYEANVHIIGQTVIKCIINPYARARRPEHLFIYGEDDTCLTGEGLPETMRDSQMGVSHAARMVMDNGSLVSGPQMLLRLALLAPGQDTDIYANKVWLEDPDAPETNKKLLENVSIDAHLDELMAIINLFREFADTETALPPPALGDVTQGGSEALRTRGNASMFLGAAALPLRDIVRNFDRFTRSVIGSLYDWNMEFNPDPNIKGDFNVIARGSTSLIAKEVLAQALDYLAQTIRPSEEVYINDKKFLEQRMKVRDLDLRDVLEDDEEVQRKIARQGEMAARQQSQQEQLVAAQIREVLAKAMKAMADARASDVGTDVQAFQAIMKGLIDAVGAESGGEPAGPGSGDSRKPRAKRRTSSAAAA